MKTDPISVIKGLNGLHYAKTSKSRVFLPLELEDSMYNKISSQLSNLEYFANITKKPIVFYPKGEHATLMNYGSRTTVLNNDAAKSDIAVQMYKHVTEIFNQGRKKNFSKTV